MARAFVLAAALLGCGDNLAPPIDASTVFVEAMPGSGVIPQVIDSGGPIMASPIVQPIFFANVPDPDTQPYVEAFLPALASSSYWTAVGTEYGIGPFTVMPSIVSSDPVPATDMAMALYLAGQLDGTHMGWPVADTTSTIYMVMLPSGATFSGACTSFGGYHSENTTGGADFVYAVIANCGASQTGATALDEVTNTISHEMIEASTDPKFSTAPAWESTDSEHLAWSREGGAEIGDMCEWSPSAQQRLVGTYLVQRIWSNAAAAAGHDPCVPALPGPYFNAAPVIGDVAVATHGGGTITTLGLTIATGSAAQVDLRLFSDAPADPWDITVIDGNELLQMPTSLSIEYGRTAGGSNGDTVSILVRRDRDNTHGNLLFVENKPADDDTQVPSYWWIFVQ